MLCLSRLAFSITSIALVISKENAATATVSVNGSSVNIVYGYPKAATADWAQLLDIDADFKTILLGSNIVVHPKGIAAPSTVSDTVSASNNCYVYYGEAASGTTPTIKVVPCQ